ncbi:2,4-dienoyl-CoA reductase-like NADH-dependent reductase (Old Yellow Enzyme family) [Kushneria sinocarnis]|uniref:2,4-dienoyl-CoA reductase-like NADH-dependent reductase (Old Yellow Enzyme family) n=1 Tax=Kushneria sinocarnis TaxID=595502 RepID=A0A420X0X6_9GAMM|nr:NADH:flavin oxidoreductase/NADH oxidase [Kushneria sinocarnis]RKR07400.1 2,4-dienoyl-CoA reductase-like NADH-dependent reductase (Old Yellow Enzyme family) [Kushneria sinocarnis]
MSAPRLFEPLRLDDLELRNRIIIAPMCQYSADHGSATDWHLIHLGHLALSGAGLLLLEATAVSPEGRISPADLGLYSDDNEQALACTLSALRAHSDMPIGIQLGHAGRKASTTAPWQGGEQIPPEADNGWQTLAPSALPHGEADHPPSALSVEEIERIKADFVTAAERAARLGLEAIELHAAHGYLLHQFLSPLSNRRDDEYGGSPENRLRLVLEVFDAVREVFPKGRPVGVRVSASDWAEGGWDIEGTLALARALDERGCSYIHVSSGGLTPAQQIPVGPGYQVPFARRVREAVEMPVIAVGLINEPEQAEAIVGTGEADAIALARAMLYNPRWPWHAAAALGATVKAPNQYLRSQPRQYRQLFDHD